MRVIVTGGCGFIGSHLVRHLIHCGDEVLNVDKMTYAAKEERRGLAPHVQLDICDSKDLTSLMLDYRPEVVYHLAAETHVDNSIARCDVFSRTNVEGTVSVLDACIASGSRICHVSTDEVYGPADSRPFHEDDPMNPQNPYSATKAAGDMMVRAYHNTHKIPYIIVRPSNNYGPGQHEEKFIPKFLRALETNGTFPMYGKGDQMREWTYVEDTAREIRRITIGNGTNWNAVFNVSSGITMTNLRAAETIASIYSKTRGIPVPIEEIVKFSPDRPGHDRRYWIDSSRLHRLLDVEYTSFEDGISSILSNR